MHRPSAAAALDLATRIDPLAAVDPPIHRGPRPLAANSSPGHAPPMPPRSLDSLTLLGFKSIRALDEFPLTQRNVLIGGNGAGKSNVIDLFRLLRALARDGLRAHVARTGGGEGLLFHGPRGPGAIEATLMFGDNSFRVRLQPTASDELMVKDIAILWMPDQKWRVFPRGGPEAEFTDWAGRPGRDGEVHAAISSWSVHHFRDTGPTAPIRQDAALADHHELAEDGGNLAAFLAHLHRHHPATYPQIREAIAPVVPFLDDFVLAPRNLEGRETVRLQWRQKDDPHVFAPSQLSDATLRFLALVTVLLQPTPPATIVLDEPELGLHPVALRSLAALLHATSARTQIIVATQSPQLVRRFAPDDIILVSREGGASELQRMTAAGLAHWLAQHDPGDLITDAAAPT